MATAPAGAILVDGVYYAPVASDPAAPVASAPTMDDNGRFVPVKDRPKAARYTCSVKHPNHPEPYSLKGMVYHQSWCNGSATEI